MKTQTAGMTPGEKYDQLLSNIEAAPSNEAEIEALRTLSRNLWHLLEREQEDELFSAPEVIELQEDADLWAQSNRNGEE